MSNTSIVIIISIIFNCILLWTEFNDFLKIIKLREKNAALKDSLKITLIKWMKERIYNSTEEEKLRLNKILKLDSRTIAQELLTPGSVNINKL